MVCGFIFVWHNKYTFKNITYNAQCMIYKYIYILYNKIFPYKILLYNSVFAWELVYFNFINEMSLNYYVIKNPFNLRLPYDNNIITLNKKPLVPQKWQTSAKDKCTVCVCVCTVGYCILI